MATARDLNIDDIVEDMQRLRRTSARMYMCLSQATLDAFGRDGEMAVRFGLRASGEWRESEMRQAHHAMGLDIDMKNLIGCWDNASVYIIKDKVASSGTHKPHDVRFDVTFCPAAQAWKEAEFHQWGHVYCDEFHQACVSSYHPDGNVVIPINMMKGDDHCHFQWIMPAGAEALDFGEPTALGMRLAEAYRAETDEDAAWKSLKRSNRLVGGRYVTAARVLIDRYGDRGIEVIREGLRAWGRLRGQVLRREHEKRGWPLDLVTLMHHHDLPYQTVWEVAERVAEPDRFRRGNPLYATGRGLAGSRRHGDRRALVRAGLRGAGRRVHARRKVALAEADVSRRRGERASHPSVSGAPVSAGVRLRAWNRWDISCSRSTSTVMDWPESRGMDHTRRDGEEGHEILAHDGARERYRCIARLLLQQAGAHGSPAK